MVLKPTETKQVTISRGFTASWQPGSFAGAPGTVALFNIFASIPRATPARTEERSVVAGQEFYSRGVAVRWIFHYPVTSVNASSRTLVVRISIIESDQYYDTLDSTPPNQFRTTTATDVNFFDPNDGNAAQTSQRFNADRVKVLASRKFYMCSGNSKGWLNEGKLWLPLRRKMHLAIRETPSLDDYVRELRDHNYYFMWEMFDADGLVATSAGENFYFNVDTTVYWKDP